MSLTAAFVLLSSTLLATPAWHDEVLSDSPEVRAPVLARLHAKGRPGLYALQDLVEKSATPEERAKALRALGELGDSDAEWELRLQFRQTSPLVIAATVRAAAALKLTTLGRPSAEKVGDPDPALCLALGTSAAIFPDIAEAAHHALGADDANRALAGFRVLEAAGLAVSADDAHRLAGSALPDLRFAATLALAASDPDAAVDGLRGFLDDPTRSAAAIAAIGKIGSPRALTALAGMIQSDHPQAALAALASSEQGVRLLLQRRLVSIVPAQTEAIDAALAAEPHTPALLVALLDDPTADIAKEAALLLGQKAEGVAVLEKCVEHLQPEAVQCASGLAESPLAGGAIDKVLQSVEAQVRADMLNGLAGATGVPHRQALAPLVADPSPAVRAALAPALGRLKDDGSALLFTLVRDSDSDVRAAAATELAHLLPPERLRSLVSEALSDPAIRPALLPIALKLPKPDALRLLVASLASNNRTERRQALAALSQLNDPQAVKALMDSAAKDADPELREYALTLLANE